MSGQCYRSTILGLREYISQTADMTYFTSEASCIFEDDVPVGFEFEPARMGYVVKNGEYLTNSGLFDTKELAEKMPYPDFVRFAKKNKGCTFEDT